jgi:glycosyltransferase involved in cell wall biosynthesis
MRVAIDFKVLGTEAAMRGMGRYTQQQAFEALRADPSLELFFILQDKLEPDRCVYDWLAMPRVHPIWLDDGREGAVPDTLPPHELLLRYSHRLQATLRNLGVDLFHNATPFLPPYYTGLTRVPVVATCYDLIPLIFPRDYFVNHEQRDAYYRMLRNLRSATRVTAISHSAATDLRLYTGYPSDRIDITHPFVEDAFRRDVVDQDLRAEARYALRKAIPRLPERFILSVTGIHHSKNAGFLLECFAKARQHRDWPGLPLVILLPAEWTVSVFRDRFGDPEGTIVLSDVSEEELRDLYLSAEFVFQPSLYEGFGYPVAEAMHCGAAVIGTQTASIPEIAGDAALLVDPTDREKGTAAMLHLATNPAARDRLRAAAHKQAAAHFGDPARLGTTTVASWRAAAASGVEAPRTRVAIWSSMPPLDCGIADYTAELVDALAADNEVDVYTDGRYMPSPRSAPNIHFRHVRDFDVSESGLTHRIFQLQARDYQAFMYPEIIAHGGTIMLHDISLAIAFYGLARYLGRYSEFEDHMIAVEGPDAVRDFGVAMARSGGVPHAQAFKEVFDKHPVLRWAVGGADRVLTHTDSLARDLLGYYPDAPARVVRQGYGDRLPIVRNLPLPLWRRRVGVVARGLIVGVFGIVGRNKRIEKAIGAFEQLWKAHPDSVLVIAGIAYDKAYGEELASQVRTSPAAARIVIIDYVHPDLFHALIALCDVLVNLRWPALGGLSAVLIRGLVAGKPVIVSDIPDWREVGSEACLRVAPDDAEVDGIVQHLLRLADDAPERARLGRIARNWFFGEATLDAMVSDHLMGGRAPSMTAKGSHT